MGFAIAVARVLAPHARGEFAILQTVNGLAFVAGNAGISRAAIHHIGKELLSPQAIASVSLSLATLSGAVVIIIMIPITLAVRHWAAPTLHPLWLIVALLLSVPLIARDYLNGTLIATRRPSGVVASNAAQPVVAVATLMFLIAMGPDGTLPVLTAWGAGILASALVASRLTLKPLHAVPRLATRGQLSLVVFGLKTYPANLARFLNLRLDQLLVPGLASITALGYYAVAVNLGEMLLQIPIAMLWALSGAISSATRTASVVLVIEFCRWAFFIALAVVVPIAIAAPVAVPFIFGAAYAPAVPSVLLLLPGMVFYAPAIIIGEYYIVQRAEPMKAAIFPGVAVAVGVILNVALTPRLGAAGASIASTASYAAMLAVALLSFREDTGEKIGAIVKIGRADIRKLLTLYRG